MAVVKRLLATPLGIYLGAALVSRGLEGTGAMYRCACQSECWCRKPGLTLFRWVFPYGHKLGR